LRTRSESPAERSDQSGVSKYRDTSVVVDEGDVAEADAAKLPVRASALRI
jgi:hypothetical protein